MGLAHNKSNKRLGWALLAGLQWRSTGLGSAVATTTVTATVREG